MLIDQLRVRRAIELPWGGSRSPSPRSVRTSSRLIAEVIEDRRVDVDADRRGRSLRRRTTCPTPGTCESFCARMIDAASYICGWSYVSDVIASIMIGASAGLTFAVRRVVRKVGRELAAGGVDRRLDVAGGGVDVPVEVELERDVRRAERAASSVISVTPAIRPNCRSSGVATESPSCRAGARQRRR